MVLAELEIWHSRPLAPTRRIALGRLVLPCDPAPGFGGVLLGAVVASHAVGLDDDVTVDLRRLLGQVERGERVPQPRLRNRFQVDRHGLTLSTHRLVRDGDEINFHLVNNGTDIQQVLGAVYALERLDPVLRRAVMPAMRRALTWRGPIGKAFIAHLAGNSSSDVNALADPRAWALDVLGFPGGTLGVSRREVMSRYRERLRHVHPDHGGDGDTAHRRILDITEARRVLLDSL
jgi:hypothetical protein